MGRLHTNCRLPISDLSLFDTIIAMTQRHSTLPGHPFESDKLRTQDFGVDTLTPGRDVARHGATTSKSSRRPITGAASGSHSLRAHELDGVIHGTRDGGVALVRLPILP